VNRLEAGNRLSVIERMKETGLKEEGMRMRTRTVTTLVLALFLGSILVASASAQPKKPLRCELTMEVFWLPELHWEGTVTGYIEGTITVTELPPSFPGKTEHFSEIFEIVTANGLIRGVDEGVWNMKTYKWRANGKVTEATGIWADLVGCRVHEMGTTSPLGAEVTAWGTITIMHG